VPVQSAKAAKATEGVKDLKHQAIRQAADEYPVARPGQYLNHTEAKQSNKIPRHSKGYKHRNIKAQGYQG
jgi:hypothetical protein